MVLLPFEITKCLQPFKIRTFVATIPKRFNHDTLLLTLLMWLLYAWKCILERRIPEALVMIQSMLRLLVLAPECNKLLIQMLVLQGKVNHQYENYQGALKSFQKIRDIAQDVEDHAIEKESYALMAKSLKALGEYTQAVIVLKRMLQLAWVDKDIKVEMRAYEMIAGCYFCMQDLLRADYFIDRAMRGKFEVESSKTRELSDQNYKRKKQIRHEQWKQLPAYD